MADEFANHQPGLNSPAMDIILATPNDSTLLDPPARGIMVSVLGTVRVTTAKGNLRDIPSALLSVGSVLPLRCTKIHATGTTATVYYLV